jgi:hypothetical protein
LWPVVDLRAFLTGSWQFDRSLLDQCRSVSGTVNGRAHFVPSRRSLLYEEHGMLTFGAHHGPAEQRLKFELPSENWRASVRFCDGRTFHELDLSQGEAAVSYACDPDLYEGRFVAMSANQWQSAWNVKGPRKDQEIVTLYTRLG